MPSNAQAWSWHAGRMAIEGGHSTDEVEPIIFYAVVLSVSVSVAGTRIIGVHDQCLDSDGTCHQGERMRPCDSWFS
jgi:hypothetical protein